MVKIFCQVLSIRTCWIGTKSINFLLQRLKMEVECQVDVVDEQTILTDNDGAWKAILHAHFRDFIAFFWSEAYEAIDWTQPYQALEQELLEVGLKGDIGKRYIDKLFQVYLKEGTQQWILIHIEIQHKKNDEFPKRQFIYLGA